MMSTTRLSASWAIWRARRKRSGGDKAYAFYAFLLVAAIVIVPIVRALWIMASSPTGLAVLASTDASSAMSMIAATLWGGAMLVGRKRGPALLPPFLLHALSDSGIHRALTLRRPVLRSSTIIVAACAGGAVLVGMALLTDSYAHLSNVMFFVASALATGVVTATLWLIGQVFPRTAPPIALAVLGFAGISLSVPQILAVTPWGWVGATYPIAGSSVFSMAGVAVLAAASIIMIPVLLNRLTGMQLSKQASQWERAATSSSSLDFRAATAVYAAEPQIGRNIRAITPSRHRWATFFLRDVVGQVRMPGQLLGTITATVIAGALITLSLLPGAPAAFLAGIAGLVLYGATGPLTKGLQHAASVAGDYPLYGISDRHLVLLHVLFPLTALLAFLATSATITAFASGAPLGVALAGAGAVGVLTLALRFGNALKGPLPPSLLTPINTPAGDIGIVMQIGWALSDSLIAMIGALTITLLPVTPFPFVILGIWSGVLVFVRWKKRR
jgi:hypothetical protein